MSCFIECLNLQCHFKGHKQGEDFTFGPASFCVDQGEIISVIGPSGSGKTTFLRMLSGLIKADSGSITIDQQVVQDDRHFVPVDKRPVGLVFQDFALFPHMTAKKNILFGITHLTKKDQVKKLKELSDLLKINHILKRYPSELSGGEQQRVAIARTLAREPKLILLDEPLSNIDADQRSSIAQELTEILKKTNSTTIWVTHDQNEALDLSDRVLIFRGGKLEQYDTPWKIYHDPKTRFVADFIGEAVFINGKVFGEKIITEIGTIDCPPCLQQHQKLEIMIRPDDINAYPEKAGAGTIVKRQFFGSQQLYTIKIYSGQLIKLTQPSHINWNIGDRVCVHLKMRSVVAFPYQAKENE